MFQTKHGHCRMPFILESLLPDSTNKTYPWLKDACFPRYHMIAFDSALILSLLLWHFLRSLFLGIIDEGLWISGRTELRQVSEYFLSVAFPLPSSSATDTVNEKECLFFDYKHMEVLPVRVVVNHSVCWHCRWYNEQTPRFPVLKAFVGGLKTEITGPFSLEKAFRIIWV